MNVSKKLFLFFVALYSAHAINYLHAHPTDPIGQAETITNPSDLYNAMTSQTPTAIALTMDACSHCNALKPHFNAAAQNPKYKNINFYIANGLKLKAAPTVQQLSKGTINIPGYPSILHIKNGTIVDYQIGGNPKTLTEKLNTLAK